MDESIRESLAGFDAVWQRVAGLDSTPERTPDRQRADPLEDHLAHFIHEETCAAVWAAALARLFGGEARTVLLRQAADARRHLKRLRAEYFIAAGVPAGGNQDCRDISGKLASLRTVYLQARDRAADYEEQAERAPSPELREMFAAFAGDEARHAREARRLILASFQ